MDYTIKKLSDLAGISTRTLRYYDEINLLKPQKVTEAGYRVYGEEQINKLQQILFYKSMDIELKDIKEILSNPDYDVQKSLENHYRKLIEKREHLEALIKTVEKTIAYSKGEIDMTDTEKFECFKKEKIKKNEKQYGKEIRKKYGEESVSNSYNKFSKLTEEEFKEMAKLENEMIQKLLIVNENKDLNSDEAKIVFENHKKWLSFNMEYKKEIHQGLAEMYVLDERFAEYYNKKANKRVVETLRDIILEYTKL